MPNKAYAIIHDGTNLLVARGGRSGDPATPRSGNHFPGGTVPQSVPAWKHLMTEIQEETGLPVTVESTTESVPIDKKKAGVLHFFVIRVGSVEDLVQAFKRPAVVNSYDEPFERVEAVPIDAARANGFFNKKDWTDWFGEGLEEAIASNLLS